MAITPEKIQEIADPIEEIYMHMVDELLINIGKHVTAPTWTHTAAWEVAKLSELGQLTKESAEIINKWIKSMPQQIREAMEETRAAALDKLEKQMDQAVKDGVLPPPVSDSVVNILKDYSEQAADKLNLVNTTMLQSTLEQYARCVQLTAEDTARAEATQRILNEAAGNVAIGVETRRVAMRRAIGQIADEGLTGFIDRAGHHWTPEAYVNMDIRTTVHNVAIQSTKAFMGDYDCYVFQVSSHAAARPLCYPYQGKFYSWDNSSGSITLGNGQKVDYEPLNVTSYGQAAGLFGINCGHYPIPIIPGETIPHGADNIQDKEANDKAYAESQEQRALERKIREAKRVVEMAGDTATEKDKERVKKYQQEMREFIDRTGRTRRYDREQIGGTPPTKGQPGSTLNWGGATPPTTPTAPNEPTFSDKINEIRNQVEGAPTTEQINAAGSILADEYAKHAAENAELYQKQVDEQQARIQQYEEEREKLKKEESAIFALVEKENRFLTDDELLRIENMTKRNGELLKLIYQESSNPVGETQQEKAQWLSGYISQVREVGTAGINVSAHMKNSKSEVRKNVEFAYSYYPRDWVQASVDRGTLSPKKVSRGYYSDWKKEIAISGWTEDMKNETAFHELGHRFEKAVSGILEQEKEFYDRRTEGEELKWLGSGYRKDEKSRKDDFVSPYMGKDYHGYCYELVSMGFQYAYTDPDKLAKDKDMQQWIYGLLLLN